MDVFDQAKAVWSALDEMAAKNPEGYQKFIYQQLHGEETQEMLKKLNLTSKGGSRPTEGKTKVGGQQRQEARKEPKAGGSSKSSKMGAAGDSGKVLDGEEKAPSILTNIVGRSKDDDQEEIGLEELKLPGDDKKMRKTKLIEEL